MQCVRWDVMPEFKGFGCEKCDEWCDVGVWSGVVWECDE